MVLIGRAIPTDINGVNDMQNYDLVTYAEYPGKHFVILGNHNDKAWICEHNTLDIDPESTNIPVIIFVTLDKLQEV